MVLGVVDLSPDQKDMDEIKFRLVNNKTGEMTPFPLTEETNIKLTKREVEILKLVNKGMFSKEISDSLSISVLTVNNHRQNMPENLDCWINSKIVLTVRLFETMENHSKLK